MLEDGYWIEHRERGWVVVDKHGEVLVDVDDPSWAADDVDPETPIYFDSPQNALVGFRRSELIKDERSVRRDEALKQLEKEGGR
jgi:hypothetical protein